MWQELGLEEMSYCDEDPATAWDEVDSGESEESRSESPERDSTMLDGDGDGGESDCELAEMVPQRALTQTGL